MRKYAGIDVHSKQCVFAILDETGKELASGRFETSRTAIAEFCQRYELGAGDLIGMETGSITNFVASGFDKQGVPVKVIEAGEVRKKARSKKQKSDLRDAREIADGIRRDIYVSVVVRPDAFGRKLKKLLSARRHVVRIRSKEAHAAKAALRAEGLRHIYKTLTSGKAWKKLLANELIDTDLKALLQTHETMWLSANAQVALLDQALGAHGEQRKVELERLQTMPGVGPITALTVIAHIGDPKRFDDAKRVGSFAGLVPSTYDSGQVAGRHGHITKHGPSELRAMLCEAAQHANRKAHPLHAYFGRIKAKSGYKIAIVAVAHRMLRILWGMMKNETAFDPALLSETQRKAKQWEAIKTLHA
jgi:transposase